ncbi:MAG: beta-glucosidase, partial [Clostridia bacterium]|nr:beta-glucosidase [Clostridia bacterium]
MDIDNLLSKMSLEEKLCQMTQINGRCVFKNDKEGVHDFIALGLTDEQYDRIGSVLAYTVDFGAKKMQDEHLKNDPNKIPLVIMLDVIHGWRTAFPIPLAIGATFNTDIAKECCKIAAQEATADGVMVAFSPMVDLARDARWGRIMETTSEDAYLNGEFGKAMIRGYHEGGLAVCVKHYAAYGGAEAGRDYNSVDMSEHTLREYYLRAYRECLEENPELFMTSFNSLNGIPSSANKHLMLDILRDEWGYNGVVISDYAAVNELISHKCKKGGAEAAKAAINCTVDIEMCTSHYIKQGEKLVKEGRLSEETVNASVRRILKLKEKLGLFDNPYYKLKGERAAVTAESRAAALRAASES